MTSNHTNTDANQPKQGEEVADVHYLPTSHVSVTPDNEVLEGELVTDAEYALLTTQKAKALERYRGYRRDAVAVAQGVKTVATHDYTKTTGRTLLRQASYVLGGGAMVAKRVWETKTNSRYERMMRAAEARGDWEQVGEWEARGEQARERRHRRRMD